MNKPPLIILDEAIVKYKLHESVIIGRVLRGELRDPMGGLIDGVPWVYDDWRLQRLADNSPAVLP